MPQLPTDLVQHVARELLERVTSIKIKPALMREISAYPLPIHEFKSLGFNAPLSQWRVMTAQSEPEQGGWLRKLNPFRTVIESRRLDELLGDSHQPAASLVFAPLVLDGANDMLEAFAQLPNWFSEDGELLFATLSAGSLPEIVNAEPEWLELLTHWPNIMDAGARLQDLRFGLPVLDVETIQLSYRDFDALWADVQAFIPALNSTNQEVWRNRLQVLFANGLRQISVQVLYGQVWQVQAKKHVSDTHTVSLESLTAQLHHRKTFGETE